jgi:hypothetical protein
MPGNHSVLALGAPDRRPVRWVPSASVYAPTSIVRGRTERSASTSSPAFRRAETALGPSDLLGRLCGPPSGRTAGPRPRSHRIRYHGVYATRSKLRPEVLPAIQDIPESLAGIICGHGAGSEGEARAPWWKIRWAQLLRYVFDADLRYPRCSSDMEIISFILDQPTIRRILESVGHPGDSPPGGEPENHGDRALAA